MSKYARGVAGIVAMTSIATLGIGVADVLISPIEAQALSQDAVNELGNIKQMISVGTGIIALLNNGDVYSSGLNTFGTLGTGYNSNSPTPVKVASGVKKIVVEGATNYDRIRKVFLIKNDGTALFAGENSTGISGSYSSGTGSTESTISTFTEVSLNDIENIFTSEVYTVFLTKDNKVYISGGANKYNTPTLIDGLSDIKEVFFNERGVYFLKNNGDLYGGSSSTSYVFADDGTTATDIKPKLLTTNVKKVVGTTQQMVLKNDGSLYGATAFTPTYATIGDGSSTANKIPKKVADDIKDIENNYSKGTWYINNKGEVYYSGVGAIGTGLNSQDYRTFTRVPIYESVNKILSKGNTTFFICDNGKVYASSINSAGQIGDGTKTATTLKKVDNLTNMNEISVSDYLNIGKKSNGTWHAFGVKYSGGNQSYTGGYLENNTLPENISSIYLNGTRFTLEKISINLTDYYRFIQFSTYISGLSKFDTNIYDSNIPVEVKYSTNNNKSATLGSLDADANDIKLMKYLVDGSRVVVDNYGSIQYYPQGSNTPTSIAMDGTDITDIKNSIIDSKLSISLYKSDGSIYYFDPSNITKPKLLPITQSEIKDTIVLSENGYKAYLFAYVKTDGSLVYFNSSRAEVSLGINMNNVKEVINSTSNNNTATTFLMNDGTVKMFNSVSNNIKDISSPDGVKMISALSNTYFLGDNGFIYGHNGENIKDLGILNNTVSSICNNVLCLKNGTTYKLKSGKLETIADVNSKLMKSLVKLDEDNTYVLNKDDSTYGIGEIISGDLYDSGIEYSQVVAFISSNESTSTNKKYLVLDDGSLWGYDTSSNKWVKSTMISLDSTALNYAKESNPVSFDNKEVIENLVKIAEDSRYTDTADSLKVKYDSAKSAVTSSGADSTTLGGWNNRLASVLDYYNKLDNAETLVETAEGNPTSSTITTARDFVTNSSNLSQSASNTLSLIARLDALKSNTEISEATESVVEAERCMKEELSAPILNAYTSAKSKVDILLESSDKTNLSDRLVVVKDYYDNKFKPAEDKVVELEGLIAGGIDSSNITNIKSKYTLAETGISGLTQTSDYINTVTLKNRLNIIDTAIKNYEANSGVSEATVDVAEAERCMKEELSVPMLSAYNSAKLKVDALPTSSEKTSLLNRLSVVKTYHDSKFKVSEDLVILAETAINQSSPDLADAKAKYNTAINSINNLNQTIEYKNTVTLRDRLKVVLDKIEDSEKATVIQGVQLDINDLLALRYTDTTVNYTSLQAKINSTKAKVNALDSAKYATEKANFLSVILDVDDYRDLLLEAERYVINAETSSPKAQSLVDTAKTFITTSLLKQDATNTVELLNRLKNVESEILNDNKSNAENLVKIAENSRYTDLSADISTKYNTALIAVNKLQSSTEKTDFTNRLAVVETYRQVLEQAETKVSQAEISRLKSDIDSARTFITSSTLKQDASNTIALLNRLKVIEDELKKEEVVADIQIDINDLLELRYTDVTVNYKSLQAKISSTRAKVNALDSSKYSIEKATFLSQIFEVDDYRDILLEAETKVVLSESVSPKSQSLVDSAKVFITTSALKQDAPNTLVLLNRLKQVEDSILNDNKDNAEKLVEIAENARYTDLSSDVLLKHNTAKVAVDKLQPGSPKTELTNRLNAVLVYQGVLSQAESKVENAESLNTKVAVTQAREFITSSTLNQGASNTVALLNRLKVIEDSLTSKEEHDNKVADIQVDIDELLALRYTDTSVNYTVLQDKITSTRTKVNALDSKEFSIEKANFLEQISGVQDYRNLLLQSENKVILAETSNPKSQSIIDEARLFITSSSLKQDAPNTVELLNRLINVENSMNDSEKDSAEDLVRIAEESMYKDLASTVKSNYDIAKSAVDKLQSSVEKSNLLDRLQVVLSYQQVLKQAEDKVGNAVSGNTQDLIDVARTFITTSTLKQDAKNTVDLLNKLKDIEDKLNSDNEHKATIDQVKLDINDLLALRYTDTTTNYTSLQNKITAVKSKVNALDSSKYGVEKADFLVQIDGVRDYRDLLLQAESKVIIAETTSPKNQNLINEARTFITGSALKQEALNTVSLLNRLTDVENDLDNDTQVNAENLVKIAEDSRYTDLASSVLNKHSIATNAVNKLTAGSKKTELEGRLADVLTYQGVLKSAETEVESAESDRTQSSVTKARTYITNSVLKQDASNTLALLSRLDSIQAELDGADFATQVSNATRLVEIAEESRYTDLANSVLTKHNTANIAVSALKTSTEKSDLLARLDKVLEYQGKLKTAEDKVSSCESESPKKQSSVDSAKGYINSNLKLDATNTIALLNRLKDIQDIIDGNNNLALQEATKAVEKAEQTLTKTDYSTAKDLVSKLPSTSEKAVLEYRLDKVKEQIDKLIDEATKGVEKAEVDKTVDSVSKAQDLIDKLKSDYPEKQPLQDRLDKVKEDLGILDLEEEAEKKVQQAEQSPSKDTVKDAQNAIDKLPPTSQNKDELQDRLDKVIDDLIKDATQKVEQAEQSPNKDTIKNAQDAIDKVPDNNPNKQPLQDRLDKVIQDLIDEATKKVEQAEKTPSIDTVQDAQNAIDKLPNNVPEKQPLQDRLDKVKDNLGVKDLEDLAEKKVQEAEKNPNKDTINDAQEAINKIPDTSNKKESLQDRLDKVKNDLLEEATKAVEKAEQSKTDEDIDSAQGIVDKLPDGTDKDNLQDRLNAIKKDDEITDEDKLLEEATKAVEKAEQERTQPSKDYAQSLVDKLSPSQAKDDLQDRLDKIVIDTDIPVDIDAQKLFEEVVKSYRPSNLTTEEGLKSYVSEKFENLAGYPIIVTVDNYKLTKSTKDSYGSVEGYIKGLIPDLSNTEVGTNLGLAIDKDSSNTDTGNNDGSTDSNTGGSGSGSGSVTDKKPTNGHSSNSNNSDTTSNSSSSSHKTFSLLGISRNNLLSDVSVKQGEQNIPIQTNLLAVNSLEPLTLTQVPYEEKVYNQDGIVQGDMKLLKQGEETIGIALKGDKVYDTNTVVSIRTNASPEELKVYTKINEIDKYVQVQTELIKEGNSIKLRGTGKAEYLLSTVNLSEGTTAKQGWNKLGNEDWTYVKGQDINKGWIQDTGKWYYVDDSTNKMLTGWVQTDNSNWYYLNPISDGTKGSMKTGWVKTGGNWYFLDSTGKMVSNRTVDGYYLDSTGKWVK